MIHSTAPLITLDKLQAMASPAVAGPRAHVRESDAPATADSWNGEAGATAQLEASTSLPARPPQARRRGGKGMSAPGGVDTSVLD